MSIILATQGTSDASKGQLLPMRVLDTHHLDGPGDGLITGLLCIQN